MQSKSIFVKNVLKSRNEMVLPSNCLHKDTTEIVSLQLKSLNIPRFWPSVNSTNNKLYFVYEDNDVVEGNGPQLRSVVLPPLLNAQNGDSSTTDTKQTLCAVLAEQISSYARQYIDTSALTSSEKSTYKACKCLATVDYSDEKLFTVTIRLPKTNVQKKSPITPIFTYNFTTTNATPFPTGTMYQSTVAPFNFVNLYIALLDIDEKYLNAENMKNKVLSLHNLTSNDTIFYDITKVTKTSKWKLDITAQSTTLIFSDFQIGDKIELQFFVSETKTPTMCSFHNRAGPPTNFDMTYSDETYYCNDIDKLFGGFRNTEKEISATNVIPFFNKTFDNTQNAAESRKYFDSASQSQKDETVPGGPDVKYCSRSKQCNNFSKFFLQITGGYSVRNIVSDNLIYPISPLDNQSHASSVLSTLALDDDELKYDSEYERSSAAFDISNGIDSLNYHITDHVGRDLSVYDDFKMIDNNQVEANLIFQYDVMTNSKSKQVGADGGSKSLILDTNRPIFQ